MSIHALWNGIMTFGDMNHDSARAMMLDLTVFPFEVAFVFCVFQLTLWEESRTIRNELEGEVKLGRIPKGHPANIASWWSRNFSSDWLPPTVDKSMYLATATSLAIRKSQLRLMGKRATPFYRDEVDRLRGQLDRVLSHGAVKSAPAR